MLFKFFKSIIMSSILSTALTFAQSAGVKQIIFNEQNCPKVFYIDPVKGDDTAVGSRSAPLKTLNQGCKLANKHAYKKKEGVRLILNPGSYPETLQVSGWEPGAALVIEAAQTGTAVIEGADRFTDWEKKRGYYTHAWPYNFKPYDKPLPMNIGKMTLRGQQREIVTVNDKLLLQVLDKREMKKTNVNCFYIDDNEIVVKYPDLEKQEVYVSVRPAEEDWSKRAGQLVDFADSRKIALKGLVIRHAASPPESMACKFQNCKEILIEDLKLYHNNWFALNFYHVENATVKNVSASLNGANGFNMHTLKNVRFENCTATNNGWRAWWGGWDDWLFAGLKICVAHDVSVYNLTACKNVGQGLWLDWDMINIHVSNAVLNENYSFDRKKNGFGLFAEYSLGPILIEDTVMKKNNAGLYNSAAQNLTLQRCTLKDNHVAQIGVIQHKRENLRNFETKAQIPWKKVPPTNNIFEECKISGKMLVINYYDWSHKPGYKDFLDTAVFRNNEYASTEARPFQTAGGFVDFSGWQEAVNEQNSKMKAGSGNSKWGKKY